MKNKVLKRLVAFIVVCLLAACVVLTWLLTMESGLRTIRRSVNLLGGDVVHIGGVSGSFASAWSFDRCSLHLPGVDIAVDRLECDWSFSSLFAGQIDISKLTLKRVKVIVKEQQKELQDQGNFKLPTILLPLMVNLEKLTVEGLQVDDSHRNELLQLDLLAMGLEGNGALFTIHDFLLRGADYGLKLHGLIRAADDWDLDLLGNWNFAGFGFNPMAGTFSVNRRLESPVVELGVVSPADIRISARAKNLLEAPIWHVKLEGRSVDLSRLIKSCPEIVLDTVTADLSGDGNGYHGPVRAQGKYDLLDKMKLTAVLAADWWGISFPSLQIERDKSSLKVVDGAISWKKIFAWRGRFFAERLDPSIFSASLPHDVTAEFTTRGDVLEDDIDVSFTVLNSQIRFHKYLFAASGNISLDEKGVATDGLRLQSENVEGFLRVEKGNFTWSPQVQWAGDVRLHNFNPSWLYNELSGNVNGHFTGKGRLTEQGPDGFFTVAGFSGTLLGNKLSGGGKIIFRNGSLLTQGLTLKSGRSELILHGNLGEDGAFDLDFSSPDLGEIMPTAGGGLEIHGNMAGRWSTPRIALNFKGCNLLYKDGGISEINGKFNSRYDNTLLFAGMVAAKNVHFNDTSIDKMTFSVTGTPSEHNLGAELENRLGLFGGRARGRYNDHRWQGLVSGLFFDSAKGSVFRQQGNVDLVVTDREISLDTVRLSNGKDSIHLNGNIDFMHDNRWSFKSVIDSISMDFLQNIGLLNIPVVGVVDGHLEARGSGDHLEDIDIYLKMPSLRVMEREDPVLSASVGLVAPELRARLEDGLLNGSFFADTENGGQVRLNLQVAGVGDLGAPLTAMPITGQLAIADFDLGFLAALTDFMVAPTGALDGNFTMGGSVADPQLFGKCSLGTGSISLPFQGITMRDLSLSLVAGEEGARVFFRATSGEGHLLAKGVLKEGMEGPEGDVRITGDNFQLLNLPEYVIRISPDIHFFFNKKRGLVDGSVLIPKGLIHPDKLSNYVQASDDVVLVGAEKKRKTNKWPFSGSLTVALGDDVRIDGYGLTGRLEGSINISKKTDSFLAGLGELSLVDGSFALYGTSLSIERGRLLFTGGPIDNPGIDVRAQRKVRGGVAKGGGYTVGIDIEGLVQDLEFRLFSDPYMEDAKILSYLMIGNSGSATGQNGGFWKSAAKTLGFGAGGKFLDQFGNVLQLDDMHLEGSRNGEDMSFVVGKRLTEDLYIGYDVNMFNQLGEFRVRYDLDRGFFVETRSSSEYTSADLLYIFEK